MRLVSISCIEAIAVPFWKHYPSFNLFLKTSWVFSVFYFVSLRRVFLASVALLEFHNVGYYSLRFVLLLDFVLRPCGVVNSTMQRVTFGFYLFYEVYSLPFVVLLDLVLRSCGVFHIAEGYLWFLSVLRGVFLVVWSSVALGPQILWCIPHCRGLPLVFICFARCIPCGLEFCCTWSSDHAVYSTLQRVTSGFYLSCEVYSLWFVVLLDLVLRSCGVFHIAEGYLWFLSVLRGVFLAIWSFVALGPQIMRCFPHCRGLPLVSISFARCISCGLEFCWTFVLRP